MARVQVTRTSKGGGVAGLRARIEGGAMTQAMRVVGESMHADIMRCFVEQRDPWGRPWPRLSQVTQERRVGRTKRGRRALSVARGGGGRRGGRAALTVVGMAASGKALQDTGIYMKSIHAFVEPPFRAGVSTNDIRANVLQFGRADNRFPNRPGAPRAPIPAREHFPIRRGGVVDVPQSWINGYLETIHAFVVQGSEGARRGANLRPITSGLRLGTGI